MKIKGIDVSPRLPRNFFDTPIEDRSERELKRWWMVPFIRTTTHEQIEGDKTYDEYVSRIFPDKPSKLREEWELEKSLGRKSWFEIFPTGIRYQIYCLDGGAWDRPTFYKTYAELDEAINAIKDGKWSV